MKKTSVTCLSTMIMLMMVSVLGSCKKENKTSSCTGGPGGSLTVKATFMHHSKYIYSLPGYRDTVYIKYNTQDYPSGGLSGFDAKVVGDSGLDYVIINGLQCGNYYFYGVARDTSVDTLVYPHVVGGSPFSFTQTSGEVDIILAVSEAH